MKELFNRKKAFLLCSIAIIFFIAFSFTCVVYKETRTYQNLAEKDLQNTVSLANLNIEKFIVNTMSTPVTVSKTMANDVFLKSWLTQETQHKDDPGYLSRLYAYLDAYSQKYKYATVFCISAQTGRYYYNKGISKTVSPANSHDIWYYQFIQSGQEFDLEVDTSEENNNKITVFVNFRLEDSRGNLLGVIGVGLQLDHLERLLHYYEREYSLSIYIINGSGVQTSFTGKTSIFVDEKELKKRIGITADNFDLAKVEQEKFYWVSSKDSLKCVTAKYNKMMNWYLIVEKDTESISNTFQDKIKDNIKFILLLFGACIIIITLIFTQYNKIVILSENKDEITGLLNRKLFMKLASSFISRNRRKPLCLFIFDIDRFKNINDNYGHLFGNTILNLVGTKSKAILGSETLVSRWGGDEFTGIIPCGLEESQNLLKSLMKELQNSSDERYRITISIGIIAINANHDLNTNFELADQALYSSKNNGKNRITVYRDTEETI